MGGLSKDRQNIYWISDDDEMFANQRRSLDVKKMLERFSSYYVDRNLGELGLGTTAIDTGDRLDEDLNSIPDLMSGAVAEVTSHIARRFGGHIPSQIALEPALGLSRKAGAIYSWIMDGDFPLKRAVVVIDRNASGGLAAFRLNMLR
jgi:hypothetical protein